MTLGWSQEGHPSQAEVVSTEIPTLKLSGRSMGPWQEEGCCQWHCKEQEGKEERGDAQGFHQTAPQGTDSSGSHGQPEALSTEAQLGRGAEEGLKVCTRRQQEPKSRDCVSCWDRKCKSLDVG